VKICTQLVFLIVTLPPRDKEEFFKAIQILYHKGQAFLGLFRAATTRTNIGYQVRESGSESGDKVVC
jgi:hypothetical protein